MNKLTLIGALGVLSLIVGCGQVDTGEVGFFTRWGEIISREPLSEGLHCYEPFGTDLITYNIKNQTFAVETEVFTKDLQSMKLEMSITYNLSKDKVIDLHSRVGRDYAKIVIHPTVLNAAKDVLGKMEAGEIVEKRELATKNINDTITSVLSDYGINITLGHVCSKLIVNVSKLGSEVDPNATVSSIKLGGIYPKGDFNLSGDNAGTWTVDENTTGDITMNKFIDSVTKNDLLRSSQIYKDFITLPQEQFEQIKLEYDKLNAPVDMKESISL